MTPAETFTSHNVTYFRRNAMALHAKERLKRALFFVGHQHDTPWQVQSIKLFNVCDGRIAAAARAADVW